MAVIALVPLGEVSPDEIRSLKPILEEAFGGAVVFGPVIPVPHDAYDPGRRQYLSTSLLDRLTRAKRRDWERVLGVANVDLFVPNLNFVFGEADRQRGVAVMSPSGCATMRRCSPGGRRPRRSMSSAMPTASVTAGMPAA